MENKTTDNAGASGAEPLVKRGYLFLEDSDWNKADEYFDKALDVNPEHAPAYIGKLCAELKVRREDSLGNYQELRQGKMLDKPLEKYGHFQKALRFADDACRNKLNGYDQKIKDIFPKKIPKQFTDEFINGEIARLEKEIAACDAEITNNEQQLGYWQSMMNKAAKNYREKEEAILKEERELAIKKAEREIRDMGLEDTYLEIKKMFE
jgi:tetratricopeptide (TPR) repeat protein